MTLSWIPVFYRTLQSKAYRTITYVAAGSWCEVTAGPEMFEERFIMEAALVNMDNIPFIDAVFVVPSEAPAYNTSDYRAYLDPSTQAYHVRHSTSVPCPTPSLNLVTATGPTRTLASVPSPLPLRPARTRARVLPPLILRPLTGDVIPVVQGKSIEETMPSIQGGTIQGVVSSIQDMIAQDTTTPNTVESAVSTAASYSLASVTLLQAIPSSSSPLSPMDVELTPLIPTSVSSSKWADLVEEDLEQEHSTVSSSSGSAQDNDNSAPVTPFTPPTPDFPTSLEDGQPLQKIHVNVKDLSPLCISLDLPLVKYMRPQPVPDIDALSDAFLRERFLKTLDLAVRECNNATWAEYVLGIYLNGGYDWENLSSSSSSSSSSSPSSSPSLLSLPRLRQYIPVVDSEVYERQYENELVRANEVEWRVQDYTTVEDLARVNTDWQFMYKASEELKAQGDYRRPVLEGTDRSVDWFWNTANHNGSRSYDPREFSCLEVGYAPQKVKVAEMHHLNFSNQPASHKNATEPEVSLWAAWSSGLVKWHHDVDLTRRRVLASQAAKLLDPFYCNDQMDPAILELQGDALREATAGYVRKVYSEGTWVNDRYNSRADTPLSSYEYECCTIDSQINRLVQPYIVYAGVDEDSTVNDDGRPIPFMPSKVHKPEGCSKYRTIESVDGKVTIIESGKVRAPTGPVVDGAVAQPQRSRMFVFGASMVSFQPDPPIRSTELPLHMQENLESFGADRETHTDKVDGSTQEGRLGDVDGALDEVSSSQDNPRQSHEEEQENSQLTEASMLSEVPTTSEDGFGGTPESNTEVGNSSGQYGMCTPGIKKALEKYVNYDDSGEETSQYSEDSPSKAYGSDRYAPSPVDSSYPYGSVSVSSEDLLHDEDPSSEDSEYEFDDEHSTVAERLALLADRPEVVKKVDFPYDHGFPQAQDEAFAVPEKFGYNGDIRYPKTGEFERAGYSNDHGESMSSGEECSEGGISNGSHEGDSMATSQEFENDGQDSTFEDYDHNTDAGNDAVGNDDSSSHDGTSSIVETSPEHDAGEYAVVLYRPNLHCYNSTMNVVPRDEITEDIAADSNLQALTHNLAYGAGDDDFFDQDSVIDDDEDDNNVSASNSTTVARETVFSSAEQSIITEFLGSQIPGLNQIDKIIGGGLLEAPTTDKQDSQLEEGIAKADHTIVGINDIHEPTLPRIPRYKLSRHSGNQIATVKGLNDDENDVALRESPPSLKANYVQDVALSVSVSDGAYSSIASEQLQRKEELGISLDTSHGEPVNTSVPLIEDGPEGAAHEQPETEDLSGEELLNLQLREFEDVSEIPNTRLSWPEFIYGTFAISLGQKAREMLRFS
ncbi:MAG: hypothetical protein Q9187_005446 [Circinaria calcarea]